jgi:ATP-dependent DNA helicase RecQ
MQEGDPYPVLKITIKGSDILFGKGGISALRKENAKEKIIGGTSGQSGVYDEALFSKLRTLRKKMAGAQHVPPYIVFSDKTLHEMCRLFPSTLSDMRKISGVGDAKLERYGEDFILEIRSYIGMREAEQVATEA